MSEELLRLSKLMAEHGLCSRREADEYIAKGQVIVDGVVVDQLGTKVTRNVKITLGRAARKQQASLITIMLNKPIGYVSSQPEPGYEPAITLITPANCIDPQGIRSHSLNLRGLAVAGRLDIDSQGLLLFTQDGRLARKVIGNQSDVEKEYLVRVRGELPNEKLKLLQLGLELDGRPLKPAQVSWLNRDQLRFVLKEGRKRQIRRMCELVGLTVIGLKRVRVGKLRLGDLPEGKWRFINADERIT